MTTQEKLGIDERINEAFQPISNFWEGLILHEFFGTGIPTIIFLLVGGAAFFTLYFGFINIRGFGLSLRTVMGRYDGLDEKRKESGEVSHFQALATAVSGTVGNGNIAGVAMAIAIGGPGATFWMILCGLLGMSSKFVECTLGVKYRDVGSDGTVYGGPMYYLSKGLKERGFEKFGKVLAVIFAVLCIGASFGGGNAAQSNQAALQMVDLFGLTGGSARTIVGIIMMIVVGIIIIGGIKRIASVTEKIVPFMALIYVLACLFIIFSNFNYIDNAATSIEFESASGILKVNKRSNIYELDFPKDNFQQIDAINSIEIATGVKPLETYIGDINMFAVFDRGTNIKDIQPNFDEIKNLDGQGLIISSTDDEFDFVSRYFCPKYGINEDPVTGSAHTTLIPYWAEKLGKDKLHAKQVSQRGGELFCENLDNRVLIGGEAKIYMRGEIELN